MYFGHSSPINKRSQQQFVWKVIHARLACNLLTALKSCSTASFGSFHSFKASNTCANCSLFQRHSSHTNIWSVMMNDSASTVSCSSAILFLILTHRPCVCFGWIDKIWSLMVTNTASVCVCASVHVCVFFDIYSAYLFGATFYALNKMWLLTLSSVNIDFSMQNKHKYMYMILLLKNRWRFRQDYINYNPNIVTV